MDSLLHPSELIALISFKLFAPKNYFYKEKSITYNSSLERTDSRTDCYRFLNLTSRSFAAVVQALDVELRDAVCVFYLVLRGLDTVEDDMDIPKVTKVHLLVDFHNKLHLFGWQCHDNGEKEKDRILLQNFDVVIAEFAKLKPRYQSIISDICLRMGKGMADFIEYRKVDSKSDWNLYCHYVAGLVGLGLTKMFSCSGLEDLKLGNYEVLANSMGLFLQKVNIIRDYLEDLIDSRTFWPSEVWQLYATDLSDFRDLKNKAAALQCLNHLINEALLHIPDCIQYLTLLRNETIFRFCAIPQVMAIATLALCFNNYDVFEKNVKIRKGLAVKLMSMSNSMDNVKLVFREFTHAIARKLRLDDPMAFEISKNLAKVDALCKS